MNYNKVNKNNDNRVEEVPAVDIVNNVEDNTPKYAKIINCQSLRVRSSKTTDADNILTTVDKNTELQIITPSDGEWTKIEIVGASIKGYVMSKFIEVE